MKLAATIDGLDYTADLTKMRSAGLQIDATAPGRRFYGAELAKRTALRLGDFVASIGEGSTFNADVVEIIPHCHGTHTESSAHILSDGPPVVDVPIDALLPCLVVSVELKPGLRGGDTYSIPLCKDDVLVTRADLETSIAKLGCAMQPAIAIRTYPNDDSKRTRDYDSEGAGFLSLDAVDFLVASNVRHLLVDLPSVDRMDDGGRLAVHRRFWDVPDGVSTVGEKMSQRAQQCTITEFLYVEDSMADGLYLLNLQVSPIVSDAVPSNPFLIPLTPRA